MRNTFIACSLLAALTGCPTTVSCPAGSVFMGAVCVVVDGGTPEEDAGVPDEDAPEPTDAGPCPAGCTAPADICDESTSTCVECLSPTDCEAGDLACVAGMCEQCDDDADCDFADTSTCDTATHTCVACDGNEDCGHGTLGAVCDTSGGDGVCVECTGDDETACAATVCDVVAQVCTDTPANSAGLCEPCVSDRQCNAGQVCVAMTWDDPATGAADPVDVGQFCLWRRDATEAGAPMGSCASNGRPYFRTDPVTSVSGVATDVCALRVSTCEALADYSVTNCMTLDAAGDARCGVDPLGDGFCRAVDATTNRCTIGCTTDDDCPAPLTCNTGVSPRVCRL